MTRINLVPVEELMDQHLFAEFREIKMVPKSLRRSLAARGVEGVLKMIPAQYTLNKGHVSFFYNKGAYLHRRYLELRTELMRRGINFNLDALLDPDGIFEQQGMFMHFWNEYKPTADALAIVLLKSNIKQVRERICTYKKEEK
jgi:deoxyribonuclease (pyrimidine dimer)